MSGKALTFSPSFFLSDVLDLLDSPHGGVSPPVVIGSTALARRLILAKLTKVGRKYFRAEVTWLCLGRGVAELGEAETLAPARTQSEAKIGTAYEDLGGPRGTVRPHSVQEGFQASTRFLTIDDFVVSPPFSSYIFYFSQKPRQK